MPVQTACSYGASMPSIDQTSQASDLAPSPAEYTSSSSTRDTRFSLDLPQSSFRPPPYQSFHFHRYRNSTSTSASSASSPATTASLLEPPSSLQTPETSPDTPASSNSYYHSSIAQKTTDHKSQPDFRFQPSGPSSQPRKQRNTRGLALNSIGNSPVPTSLYTGVVQMTSPTESEASPGPSQDVFSPTFVKPAPPRRKSTALGLTIMTPGSATFGGTGHSLVLVPPTPGGRRPAALRHFQSSPSIPLRTTNLAPIGEPSVPQFASSFSEIPGDETDYRPESREDKPAAYPDGPICIYDPHIDLYFEPTAQEASRYDVIFNVASEVLNPFVKEGLTNFTVTDLKAAINALPKQNSSLSAVVSPNMDLTDTTESVAAKGPPEYIHIPWEHNTDIVPGTSEIPKLHDIIRIIDDRVSTGKRVLIHCQCGVSRSASLIVAYGLYKNPSITVQQAYDMVKEKSKWIGPNMSLIMQLQEYRNGLLGERAIQRPRSKILHSRDISDSPDEEASVPQTAPLPKEASKHSPSPIKTNYAGEVSAGPVSAPSDFHWPSNHRAEPCVENVTNNATKTAVPVYPESVFINTIGQVLTPDTPLKSSNLKSKGSHLAIRTNVDPPSIVAQSLGSLQLLSTISPTETIESARSAEFSMSPLRPMMDDPSFGITSPRETTFTGSPLSGISPLQSLPSSTQSQGSEFAMTPITPPDADDVSLGITSPRFGSFGQAMNTSRIAILRPPAMEPSSQEAYARSALRSQLGFSSGLSSTNLREQFVNHQSSEETLTQKTLLAPSMMIAPPTEDNDGDFADALMSPRATEFTSNPFHDALAAGPSHTERLTTEGLQHSGRGGEKNDDPRSPALKGSSPIVRSILDVIEGE